MDAYYDKNIHSGTEAGGYSTKDAQDLEAVVENIDDYLAEYTTLRWDDMTFPATRIRQGATSKPDFDTTELVLLFTQNDATEIAYISEQMRHRWKLGTNIRPHVHWLQESATEPTWKIDYRFASNGEDFGSWTTGVVTTSNAYTYSSGSMVQISIFPEIDMSSYSSSTSLLFQFKVYRDDNDLTGDAKFITFDFHYQSDSLGSVEEYTKE